MVQQRPVKIAAGLAVVCAIFVAVVCVVAVNKKDGTSEDVIISVGDNKFGWFEGAPVRTTDGLALDLSTQVLSLDVSTSEYAVASTSSVGYEHYDDDVDDLKVAVAPLSTSSFDEFVPASILAAKAKQFDDGLYAAVELMAQDGTASLPGKKQLLSLVAQALASASASPSAQGVVRAALELGGTSQGATSAEILNASEKLKAMFRGNEQASKPLSFYTWSEQLENIWHQDRFLQQSMGSLGQAVNCEASVLGQTLREALTSSNINPLYLSHLALPAKMTNSLKYKSLADACDCTNSRFLPASRSKESDLAEVLGESADLMGTFIEYVRSGNISLAPSATSGWYEHQQWSLEPLLIPRAMPEASKLKLSDAYVKELEMLFKALMALTRETHAKQLDIPTIGEVDIIITPRLTIEPLAEFYRRHALAYEFVRKVLTDFFSVSELNSRSRMRANGEVANMTLLDELDQNIKLWHGFHELSLHQLGFSSESSSFSNEAYAQEWLLHSLRSDPDVYEDNRMMVPVQYYPDGRSVVWCVVGYANKFITVDFATEPKLYGKVSGSIWWTQSDYRYPVPIFFQTTTNKLLSRVEFRELCNKYRSANEIKKAIENL